MINDAFESALRAPDAQFFHNHEVISPSDIVDVPRLYRAIVLLTAGTVRIMDNLATEITYPSMPAGTSFYFRGQRIMATGTTATLAGWW